MQFTLVTPDSRPISDKRMTVEELIKYYNITVRYIGHILTVRGGNRESIAALQAAVGPNFIVSEE